MASTRYTRHTLLNTDYCSTESSVTTSGSLALSTLLEWVESSQQTFLLSRNNLEEKLAFLKSSWMYFILIISTYIYTHTHRQQVASSLHTQWHCSQLLALFAQLFPSIGDSIRKMDHKLREGIAFIWKRQKDEPFIPPAPPQNKLKGCRVQCSDAITC